MLEIKSNTQSKRDKTLKNKMNTIIADTNLSLRQSILIITIELFNKKDILINGVTKKILDQGKSFEKLGFDVRYTGIVNNQLIMFDDKNEEFIAKTTGKAYKDRAVLYKRIMNLINQENAPEYTYIRHVGSDFALLSMMKYFHRLGTKIILEFPTYPYFRERLRNVKGIIGLILDLVCNCFISKWVTISINTNGYSKIFGTDSFSIENAVDVNRFNLHQKREHDGEINLIAVSSMAKWHGYDRVIEGLKTYSLKKNKDYKLLLHFVGDGPELTYYKNLCCKYNLEDSIIFHGKMGGEDLDKLFNKCDIALSSFGLYRIGLQRVSTLKVKEYCARGIPFAYAYDEKTLPYYNEFACKFDNNAEPIDFNRLVKFYEKTLNTENINQQIREFAIKNYSFEKQFKEMFNTIRKK